MNADGARVRWFIDPSSGRILRASSRAVGRNGPAEQTTDYADWKVVDGIAVAFKEMMTRGSEEGDSSELKEVEVNPNVDPQLFERAPDTPPEKPAR